ncbi:MAG: DUF1566 domain-containing protein [Burkholderiales bacterium]|nr:DUF1566 domain-containing protein [Burkholderiales bacterium]
MPTPAPLRPAPPLRARHLLLAGALLLASTLALPQPREPEDDADDDRPAPAAAERMEVSADGTLVIDARAKVAWARCLEGTHWNGKTCAGLPLLFDRAEALAAARARSEAEGVAWRLPRALELRHLVQRRATPPGVDPALFPAAPGTWHWSGTSRIHTGAVNMYDYGSVQHGSVGGVTSRIGTRQGWAVDMGSGESSPVHKDSRLPVRLVRPYP